MFCWKMGILSVREYRREKSGLEGQVRFSLSGNSPVGHISTHKNAVGCRIIGMSQIHVPKSSPIVSSRVESS